MNPLITNYINSKSDTCAVFKKANINRSLNIQQRNTCKFFKQTKGTQISEGSILFLWSQEQNLEIIQDYLLVITSAHLYFRT